MRTHLFLLGLVAAWMLPGIAWGQQTASPETGTVQAAAQEHPVRYGFGLRFRGLFVPQSAFERFAEVVPSGMSQPELGFELIRRRGNFETAYGIAWAALSVDDGIWLDDLDHNPSLVEFDGFSWIALDVSAVWKHPFSPTWGLRYGMGIGLGIIRGDILETDYLCPSNSFALQDCMQAPDAADVRRPIDLPPVVPLMTALVGIQYTPSQYVAFNLEGGLQTTFFVGMSAAVFFE